MKIQVAEQISLHGGGNAYSWDAEQVPNYDVARPLIDQLRFNDKIKSLERESELLREKVLLQPPSKIVHPPILFGFRFPKRLWSWLPNKNTIVTVGREQVGDLILAVSTEDWDHSAIGSDDGTILPLAVSNTILGAETDRIVTASSGSRFRSGTDIFYDAFYTDTSSANGTNIEEAGIFDLLTAGTLLARGFVTPVIAKTSSNTATISHKLGW